MDEKTSSLRRTGSDHYDGRRFFNPGVSLDRSLREAWRFYRSKARAQWPARLVDDPHPAPPARVGPGELAVTFIGQSTFLLQIDGLNILTDPILSDRASPLARVGPKRVRQPAVDIAGLPPIDLVLLSHNHYDHMDLPTLRRLRGHADPKILTGLGNGRYLARRGLRNSGELDWWEQVDAGHGTLISFVPAQHWSRRGLFDRRRTLWGGFVLETPVGRIYFAGDTGYSPHFHAIREKLGAPDLALLPIGAYEPRWFMTAQHMNPEEAVQAHIDLGAGRSLGMHFATFQLTDEAIDTPIAALAAARERRGITAEEFGVPIFGHCHFMRRVGPEP